MNDWAWILFLALGVMAVFVSVSLFARLSKNKTASVWKAAMSALPEATVTHRHGNEAMLETMNAVYLIKAVPFHPEHELIVTNKTYWCVNDKPSQWRRSSKPDLIPGVVDFLSWRPETNKRIFRVGVVTPGCRNITFHINECDVVVVTPATDVYGVRLMRLSDMADFLRKAERK
jgi:hypothetical protein